MSINPVKISITSLVVSILALLVSLNKLLGANGAGKGEAYEQCLE